MSGVTSLRFSPDGSYVAAVDCGARPCESFERIDVPAQLGAPLAMEPVSWSANPDQSIRAAKIEFGPGGLFVLKQVTPTAGRTTTTARIDRLDADGTHSIATILWSSGWDISQVVPTSTATYAVASPTKAKPRKWGLYRVTEGKLAFVRSLSDPGTLTPVTPLVGARAGG